MNRRRFPLTLTLAAALLVAGPAAANEPIPAAVQKLVDENKVKLVQWAANPSVIAAVKASNAVAGGVAGSSPAKWTELADTDAAVKATTASVAGKYVDSLDSKLVNKVVVRDKAGNVVAASLKVVLYNVAHRPFFKEAITGKPYQADVVLKDVTTQVKSVQIAVPIQDGGNVIGVMHASISGE